MLNEQSKSLFKSKTLIVNVIVAVVAFFPSVAEKLSPVVIMQGLAAINIILRFATKDKLFLTE